MSDPRAERAILDAAEAYRLVEECREMRERAETAVPLISALRAEIDACDATIARLTAELEEERNARDLEGEATVRLAESHHRLTADLAARDVEIARLTRPDQLLASRELPPLPWSSPADRQPWPDAAADSRRILDANGAPIFGPRNWKESCAAIEYLVRAANRVQRAATSPERGAVEGE